MKNKELKLQIDNAKEKLQKLSIAEPAYPKGHTKSFNKGFGKWGKS